MTKRFLYLIAIAFTATIIMTILPFTTSAVVSAQEQQYQKQISSAATLLSHSQNNNSSLNPAPLPLKTIFKGVGNSVVQITSRIPLGAPNALNPQSPNATAIGSGFVYDKLGHIVTNGHVVGDSKIVDVTFVDGSRYTAKVLGTDIYGDIAVLQISGNNTQQQPQQKQLLSTLKPLVIGNSSNLQVGDQVIAIGNPFGLSDTMTTGIVSGVGRLLPAAAGGEGFSIPNTIQTDAPINPGNSGSPLLNAQGQVIGMNTAILSGTGTFSGVGFAVPSNSITKIVPALIAKGYYLHPYLGIKGGTVASGLVENMTGIPANLSGIYVDTITKNGPADKAGLNGSTVDEYSKKHIGDVITAVDGHKITRIDDLSSYIDQHKSVGDNITLTVYRNGHEVNLKTVLTARAPLLPFLMAPSAPPSLNPHPQPPTRPPTNATSTNATKPTPTNATSTNATKPTPTNATSPNAMMGANLTGSIQLGPTIAKAIASQVHLSLANASTIAEKAVGANAHAAAVRIGVVHGFLVYMALVVDSDNNFHGLLVDPGNGKVLASTPIPFGALDMMMGGGGMMGPGMGMMGPGMFG